MRINILGDKARFSFFKDVCDTVENNNFTVLSETLEKKGILVKSIDQRKSLDSDVGIIFSKKLPLNVELFFVPLVYTATDSPFEKYLFIDEFPFRTKEEFETICTYRNKDISVILYDIERRSLETDIDNIQSALLEAQKEYEKNSIPVKIYKKGDSLHKIFQMHYQNRLSYRENYLDNVTKLITDLNSLWDIDYDMCYITKRETELTNPILLNKFVSYSLNMVNDIYLEFSKRVVHFFIEEKFSDNFSYAIDLYMDYISKIIWWNKEKEKTYITEKIKKYFINEFTPIHHLIFLGTEKDFAYFMNTHQEDDLIMKKSISDFFQIKLSHFLKTILLDRISILKNII